MTVVADNGLYSADLPSNLTRSFDMHDYASLQYYNLQEGFYVLGLEDDKENLGEIKRKRLKLPGYYRFVESTVFEHTDSTARVSSEVFTNAYGFPARVGDYFVVEMQQVDFPLFYRIAVYENDDYFFQLVIWMPYDAHCDRMAWIDTITQSFRFLDGVERPVAGVR
ncbi:MAG: hypothetical protein OHK0039_22970 [Bacteroidia bacterium]